MKAKGKSITGLFAVLMILPLQAVVCSGELANGLADGEETSKAYSVVNVALRFQASSGVTQNTGGRYNITLWLRDWENKTSFAGLNITIFDLRHRLSSSYFSNGTGHVALFFLDAGFYEIFVQDGDRTVGYERINIVQNATHLIKTWAYDLNMTLVDREGTPLANHTVYLYNQMSFQPPNHTMMTNGVVRHGNITLIKDELGSLVRMVDTDENGSISFPAVWNGTYRVGILGIEEWIEEYVLGELVLTLLEPAVGQHVLDHQEPANMTLRCIRADMKLHFISASNIPMADAEISTRDTQGHLFFEGVTNATGHLEYPNIYVVDELYAVSASYGDRTVAYQVINATEAKVHIITCWTNNLTIECVDLEGQPLVNHIVLLYDQVVFYSMTNVTVVTNQTGAMLNWSMTDENGTVCFNELWNGTYWISVMDTSIITEELLALHESSYITLPCDKTRLSISFASSSGLPLSGASVIISDTEGNVIFRGLTDARGNVLREGVRTGRYRVNVVWAGTEVWSGTIDIISDGGRQFRCKVHSLTLQCKDQFGNVLSDAEVKLKRGTPLRYESLALDLQTDEKGEIFLLLPQGAYEVAANSGLYEGAVQFTLSNDQILQINCNSSGLLFLLAAAAVPLFIVTLLMERQKLRVPLEIRKYRNMLLNLESMYKSGLVEYRIYRKLKDEYEAKVIELGGREMR